MAQLVTEFCVSVCGGYLMTGWEFRWSLPGFFYIGVAEDAAVRQCGLSMTKQWWELATKGEGLARELGHHTLPSSGDLGFIASRDLLTIVRT